MEFLSSRCRDDSVLCRPAPSAVPADGAAAWEATLARSRASVPRARALAAALMREWGCAERADDVLVCVSELVANAVRHGAPPGRYVLLRMVRSPGLLRLEVHDSGGGRPVVRAAGPEDEGGRGLALVAAVADRWGVTGRRPGKVVWCELETA